MISDEELATTAKEGTHWHSITMQIAAELLERREEARKTCKWETSKGGDIETNCGHGFWQPVHQFRFCPYCGHPIEDVQS